MTSYLYDSQTRMPQESAVAIALRWGMDGWRWVNPGAVDLTTSPAVPAGKTRTLIFEKEVESAK